MKRIRVYLLVALALGLGISVSAYHNRRLMTFEQEAAINSLGNRYLDAVCSDPYQIGEIFAGSIISQGIIDKSTIFLEELLDTEGECFGKTKSDLREGMEDEIRNLPSALLELNMATEYGLSDFFDCLVEVENSFYSLKTSTGQIFDCIEHNLDIRGYWRGILIPRQPEGYDGGNSYEVPVFIEPPLVEDPSLPPNFPAIPASPYVPEINR